MLLPLLITVSSSAAYHFTLKNVSSKGALFGTLFWSYAAAALMCLIFAAISKDDSIFTVNFKEKGHLIGLLSLTLVGIEFGYLLAYKSGGGIGQVSMIAHAMSMTILLVVGYVVYKDVITTQKAIGVLSGILSFALLAR